MFSLIFHSSCERLLSLKKGRWFEEQAIEYECDNQLLYSNNCRQIIADAVSLLRLRQDLSEVSSELGDSPPPEYHRNETSTDNNDSKLIGDKHDSSNHTNYNGLSNPNIREWPACKAVNFHFPIKAALAEDGQWKYIVNNENYIQVVTGSICV